MGRIRISLHSRLLDLVRVRDGCFGNGRKLGRRTRRREGYGWTGLCVGDRIKEKREKRVWMFRAGIEAVLCRGWWGFERRCWWKVWYG